MLSNAVLCDVRNGKMLWCTCLGGTEVLLLPMPFHIWLPVKWQSFSDLITSFEDFWLVNGAKDIYFFQRIHFWKNFWRARTSARAARSKFLMVRWNMQKIMIFHIFNGAPKKFLEIESWEKIDVFPVGCFSLSWKHDFSWPTNVIYYTAFSGFAKKVGFFVRVLYRK